MYISEKYKVQSFKDNGVSILVPLLTAIIYCIVVFALGLVVSVIDRAIGSNSIYLIVVILVPLVGTSIAVGITEKLTKAFKLKDYKKAKVFMRIFMFIAIIFSLGQLTYLPYTQPDFYIKAPLLFITDSVQHFTLVFNFASLHFNGDWTNSTYIGVGVVAVYTLSTIFIFNLNIVPNYLLGLVDENGTYIDAEATESCQIMFSSEAAYNQFVKQQTTLYEQNELDFSQYVACEISDYEIRNTVISTYGVGLKVVKYVYPSTQYSYYDFKKYYVYKHAVKTYELTFSRIPVIVTN